MAGRLTGVEPLETPGVYRASYGDGSSMLVHGQPGEDLYERYKPKPAALGPEATADASSLMSTPDENMSRADVPMGGPAPSAGPTKLAGGGVSIPLSQARAMSRGERVLEQGTEGQGAQPAPQAAPERPAQTGPVAMGYAMKGIDPATGKEVQGNAIRMPDGSIGIMLPGSRGTPGGLTTLGKEALKHGQEAEFQYANQNRIAAEARQEGVDLAKREADERAGFLEEQKQRALDAMKQQQEEQAQIEQRVSQLQSKYDKARDDFMDSKVDPDEYMKRRGGAVGMFSALGVAMSQFGGAFTGQPNVAMQFVNNQIDRSIKAQEAQISIKGRAADNMLADLTRETGSLANAKLAMRQLLTERSAIEMQQIGASTKSAQIQSLATETAAKAAAQSALLDQQRKQQYLEHVMTSPLYYQKGRAGTPNRIALPTQEAMAANQAGEIKGRELALKEAKEAATKDGKDKVSFRGQTVIATARVARGAIKEMADAIGVERDENGHYKDPSWWSAVDAKIPYSDTRQKVNALKGTFMSEVGKAQTGGVLTENAAHEMKDQIEAASTPGELGALLRHYDHTMAEVERQTRLTAGSVHNVGNEREDDEQDH